MLLKKRSPTSILGTLALTGIVISYMIGGGIFSLPQIWRPLQVRGRSC